MVITHIKLQKKINMSTNNLAAIFEAEHNHQLPT